MNDVDYVEVEGSFTVDLWHLIHKQERLGGYDGLLDWMLAMADLPIMTQEIQHRATMVDDENETLKVTVSGFIEGADISELDLNELEEKGLLTDKG